MPVKTERKTAPAVKVNLGKMNNDSRHDVFALWEENEPECQHIWKSKEGGPEGLEAIGYKVCRNEDGTPVENGLSILCAVPKKDWVAARKTEEKLSLDQLKTVKRDDGRPMFASSLTKFANPKRPKQPEDED